MGRGRPIPKPTPRKSQVAGATLANGERGSHNLKVADHQRKRCAMKKNEISVGGLYLAKVSNNIVTVMVGEIRDTANGTRYDVVNLATGRKTTFRSAAKFRAPAPKPKEEGKQCSDPTLLVTESAPTDALLQSELSAAAARGSVQHTDGEDAAHLEPSDRETMLRLEQVADRLRLEERATKREGEHRPDPTWGGVVSSDATVSVPTNSVGASVTRIADKIATARSGRQRGTPVAGMTPNDEQEEILAAAEQIAQGSGQRVLVVAAGAGTGKTATLKMLEQVLPGRGQYTAFNASLVTESKAKFQKAACNTTHSLAFRAVGKQYQHRLGGERMRSAQIAHILGIEDITVEMDGPFVDPASKEWLAAAEKAGYNSTNKLPPEGWQPKKIKRLKAEFFAGQVLAAIRRFCQSADREIGARHLRHIAGIDDTIKSQDEDGEVTTHPGHINNDLVRDYLLPFCAKAWTDLSRLDGQLPFSHDCYVKLWQLGTGDDRPIITADYILLDEAQDTAPVFLDILQQQTHALLIFVGDSNQAIYEWRGAVDAMKAYPDDRRCLLSQSYRFGQAIADVANAVLATLEEPTDLRMRGNPQIASRVEEVKEPMCYLYRTNAGAVGRVMVAIGEGKKPHLIGGGADVVAWCQAAIDIQAKRGTQHPELCCFDTWAEVVEYSKTDEGSDIKLMVKLITEFGAAKIRDALKDMPAEEDADLVVSTAHKSKGREWDTVRLGPDFPTANKMSDPDRRLLYVALTRARLILDISECPPFCGGDDWDGCGGTRWIPGIPITYTRPMPEKESEPSVVIPRDVLSSSAAKDPATVEKIASEAKSAANGKFTWANLSGKWYVRGPSNAKLGEGVKVSRKNGAVGTVVLRAVARRFADAWIYST